MDETQGQREKYLDYLARCRQAFTPFAPIELPDFFAGRAHIIQDILNELESPGRQVAIYGERGVGKSSLARLLYFFAKYDDEHVHTVLCHEDMTFNDICASLLESAGKSFGLDEVQTEGKRSAGVEAGPLSARASRRVTGTFRRVGDSPSITPGIMLSAFKSDRSLLIIDEFDRVQDDRTKTRIAEMIKHFSDARSVAKVVIVGVADTLTELVGEHQSLSRSLAQVGLGRMDDTELTDIVRRGSGRTGAKFKPAITKKIVRLADGFPHFVHLLALYASLYAGETLLEDESAAMVVGDREYDLGLKSAIAKMEHTLQEDYSSAVITTRRKSDIYELTLRAMALSNDRDVQVRKIADHASYLTGMKLRPEKFSNALGELIKPERNRVLTKVRDGYYKFTNPLMRPYIRFLLEWDNVANHDGQLEFPFMRDR